MFRRQVDRNRCEKDETHFLRSKVSYLDNTCDVMDKCKYIENKKESMMQKCCMQKNKPKAK
jgi:hypothetical protein